MQPRTLTLAFVAATLAGTAAADVVTSQYTSSSNYEFEIEHMPDFDQVRDTLAVDGSGDPGGMYCVPTSLTNLLGYIGTHGFSDAGPSEADWEADEDFDLITTYVNNMGGLAGTTGTGGTYHEPAFEAMEYFLECRLPGVFTVTENLATNSTGPTLRSIAENNINGAITSFCYGIYDDIGNDLWGRKVLSRGGGHCISFVRGHRSGSTREIEYMDPDDSSSSSTQSTFGAESYDVNAVSFVKASTIVGASFKSSRTGSRIMRTSSGKWRMIDSVIHVRPRAGYSWDSIESHWNIFWAGEWLASVPRPMHVPAPLGMELRDFSIGPFNNTLWYLDAAAQGKAYSVRLSNGELDAVDLPHAGDQLAFARDHALLVLGEGQLSRLHPFVEAGENVPATLTLQMPAGMKYMAMPSLGDDMWLAGPESRMVYRLSQRLDTGPIAMGLPRDWPNSVGVRSLAASSIPEWPLAILGGDGRINLCKVGNDELVTVGQIATDGTIHSIQFNDEGDVVAFGDQGMRLYRGEEGVWHEVSDHPFAGEQFSAQSAITMSRTNYDQAQHGGDEWRQIRDIDPVDGDIDGSGSVDIGDLLELIGLFGNQSDTADLDGDGWVGVNDMLILLGYWTE